MAGDVVHRLVVTTISELLRKARQHAMTTRAGCECIVHALQGLSELDLEATLWTVSVHDMRLRRSMLEALRQLPGGGAAFPLSGCSTPLGRPFWCHALHCPG